MGEGVPLREMLLLPALERALVVGGAAGLDHPVRQVNVMEVPDIIDWVSPDELLLTTAYPMREDPESLAALIPRLFEKGLAGIAIKPTRYIDQIPAAVISEADRLGFALLELPADTSFNDIINGVLAVILDHQAARLRRSGAIHDRFMRIVLSGGGLQHIAEALAESVSRPVLIIDPAGQLLARSSGSESVVGEALPPGLSVVVPADDPAELRSRTGPVRILGAEYEATIQLIRVGADRYGAIIVLGGLALTSDEDLEALEYSATVAALRQVQARAVAEADRRFQAVCLEELVTGHATDRGAVLEWAVEFGWDLSLPRAVLVADVDRDSGDGRRQRRRAGEGAAQDRHRLAEAARQTLGRTAIVWERSSEVAALVAPGQRGSLGIAEAAGDLQVDARRRLPGAVISVGIGRVSDDPLRLRESHAEARQARSIGRWARGSGVVTRFETLGIDRLLVLVPDTERQAFIDASIGPLLHHDLRHGTALVQTLERWLADRNGAGAARDLYVHYNTLKNRLDRVEGLIGPFIDDATRCLELGLAVRLHRLSDLGRPGSPERDGSVEVAS
ncbi:MAG TPA: PucR family transcriptional regulator ligand-binding domain-containing protein [Candidatus Limnocylindrales bacterium]